VKQSIKQKKPQLCSTNSEKSRITIGRVEIERLIHIVAAAVVNSDALVLTDITAARVGNRLILSHANNNNNNNVNVKFLSNKAVVKLMIDERYKLAGLSDGGPIAE
jgi:hypothetical protein